MLVKRVPNGNGNDGDGNGTGMSAWDRWTARGSGHVWIREHNCPRSSLCSPVGILRGPQNPYSSLCESRLTEGGTVPGRKFSISYHGWLLGVINNWLNSGLVNNVLRTDAINVYEGSATSATASII